MHQLNNINIESNEMLGKQESEANVTMNTNKIDRMLMPVDEFHDQATASNTTAHLLQGGQTATALSVGMSPGGNLSMNQRKGQRSEAFMFDN